MSLPVKDLAGKLLPRNTLRYISISFKLKLKCDVVINQSAFAIFRFLYNRQEEQSIVFNFQKY